MAEEPDTTKPGDGDESKLELPSLSFRRRKKKDKAVEAVEEPPAETVAETPVEAETPPPPVEDTTPEPEPTTEADEAEVSTSSTTEDEAEVSTGSTTGDETEVSTSSTTEDEHTQVLPSAPEAVSSEPERDTEPRAEKPAKAPRKPKVRKERKPLTLPPLAAPIAAAVTGVVVGLGIVALVYVSSRGCELVRDTGNCGGIGLVFLIAILVLAVLFGAVLLKAWQVADPMNSSFLAVGLVAVIAMLFFLSYIDEWWMVIVIPVISAGTYVLAWWVTRTFIEGPDEDEAAEEPENAVSRGL